MLCCSCLYHLPKWLLFLLFEASWRKAWKVFVISNERTPRASICIWSLTLLFYTNGLWEILCHLRLHRPLNLLTFVCSFNDGAHHCDAHTGSWCRDLVTLTSLSSVLRDPKIRLPLWLRNKDYGYVREKPFFFSYRSEGETRWKLQGKVCSFKNLCQCQGLSVPTHMCSE